MRLYRNLQQSTTLVTNWPTFFQSAEIIKMNPDTIAADNATYANADADTVMKDREIKLLCQENWSLVEERDSS